MALQNDDRRWEYTGDGATTEFQYNAKIFAAGDLEVYLDNVLTADYTVSGVGSEAGGNVTMLVAPAAGVDVVILRVVAATQPTDYVEGGDFPSQSHENGLDRVTMIVQQVLDAVTRSVAAPRGEKLVDMNLPDVATRAGKTFGFDAAGRPIATSGTVGPVVISAFMENVVGRANAALVRQDLELESANSLTKLDMTGAIARITGEASARLGVNGIGDTLISDGVTHSFRPDGTERMKLAAALLSILVSMEIPAGTAAAPSLRYAGDADTGLYRALADVLAISAGGVTQLLVGSGLYTPGATGGAKGVDSLNLKTLFIDGVQQRDPEVDGPTSLSGATVTRTFTRTGISKIAIMLDLASLSGSDEMLIRIGDSGGIETAGYYGQVFTDVSAGVPFSTPEAFQIGHTQGAGGSYTGFFTLEHATGNLWHFSGQMAHEDGASSFFCVGQKTLSGDLDRVQFLTTGADTYDAGNVTMRLW